MNETLLPAEPVCRAHGGRLESGTDRSPLSSGSQWRPVGRLPYAGRQQEMSSAKLSLVHEPFLLLLASVDFLT